MRLCVSAVLLLLLALTRAAPGPESEGCRELKILKDKTKILGRNYMLAAFTDNSLAWNAGLISSIWSDINQTQTGLSVDQFMKMNGTCVEHRFNLTISGDSASVLMFGMMTENQLLDFSNTSTIMDLRATPQNITTMIQTLHMDPKINLGPSDASQDLNSHNLYLISKEPELNEVDLQRFRTHAKCAGFTGEPVFILKSSQEYCTEEESVPLQ